MHVEIQVALNFLISFLYNKLPRRRVNQFGEELEAALKLKFEGHWYPDKPFKGSAYRCVKTTPPLDPVFEVAARESGMDFSDIQENLHQELSIWIDPGEVSYRMSEKGPVKILYSERENIDIDNPDREVTRTFNPEAQCFKPIEAMTSQFGGMSLLGGGNSPTGNFGGAQSPVYKPCTNQANGYIPKSSASVTFTTATFAQTKFGSTKLKSNTKRSHRMSPTEFSNYIKQRALQQQANSAQQMGLSQQLSGNGSMFSASTVNPNGSPQNSRSLSPDMTPMDAVNNYMHMASGSGSSGNHSPVMDSSPMSPQSSVFGGLQQQNLFSALSVSPTPNRSGFSGNLFESGYLAELLDSSVGKLSKNGPVHSNQQQQQHQQQPQSNSLNRFASFLDKASPYISAPNSGGVSSPNDFSMNLGFSADTSSSTNNNTNSNSAAKNYESFNLNLNGVSYPNQYQHLLVAN